MRRLLAGLCLLMSVVALPAFADKLAAVVPLVDDDLAGIAKVKANPSKHVLIYFGDDQN